MQEADELLTVHELANVLGLSASSIYRRRSLGQPLPTAVKIGKILRWRGLDVAKWIAGNLEASEGGENNDL